MILPGIYSQMLKATPITTLLGAGAQNQIFIGVAMKQAARPYVVLNRTGSLPAGQTLDGISALQDGEIQLDTYADKPQDAQLLSATIRDYFLNTFNAGALPDGTTIQFVEVAMDHDEPYEQGGVGYLYRALLRLKVFYTESLS